MCKFLHIRPQTDQEPNFPVSNKGGATVAYEVEENTLRYAIARCSKNDNFCRKTGRTLAAGRLKSDRLSFNVDLTRHEGQSVEEVLRNRVLA